VSLAFLIRVAACVAVAGPRRPDQPAATPRVAAIGRLLGVAGLALLFVLA
jgi:hypothetical protein